MAGDWLPCSFTLFDCFEVQQISTKLSIPTDQAAGMCLRFWAWLGWQNGSGMLRCERNKIALVCAQIDRAMHFDGFAESMIDVGWLIYDDSESGQLKAKDWELWNSKCGKNRLLSTRRMRNIRAKSTESCGESVQNPLRAQRNKNATRDRVRDRELNTPLPPKGGERASAALDDDGEGGGDGDDPRATEIAAIAAELLAAFCPSGHTRADQKSATGFATGLSGRGWCPGEIERRKRAYGVRWPKLACTMKAITTHWDQFGSSQTDFLGASGMSEARVAGDAWCREEAALAEIRAAERLATDAAWASLSPADRAALADRALATLPAIGRRLIAEGESPMENQVWRAAIGAIMRTDGLVANGETNGTAHK